ncbi:DUF3137 domain-containing protein [Pseudosulfitobacter sp. DSM 107133]|uniref:DUF3137 domain-containing protein n=1 Tax=Pseudosulfitobacter sp. DSM 107133 TaxID=2883100 RepID=UPI000DF28BF8|nr:DUF3137 domain-containing protein [Pseudosulfitobacter sp. DSM 107133]UOA28145.1 hypothetical protein DSM107133_02890 [Pseudosulfitobacter sp. DSM 107133]
MDAFTFTERAEYERGFAAIYDHKIAPFLREQEVARQAAIRRSRIWIRLIAGCSVVLAVLAFRLDPFLPIFPIFAGGSVALLVYLTRGEKVQAEVTQFIRPVISDFFEDMTFSVTPPEGAFPKERLAALGIVPVADKSSIGPEIAGNWRGISYRLTSVSFHNTHRDSDGKTKRTHLFGGIVLDIECLEEMPTVVFQPDLGGVLNAVLGWATRKNRPPYRFEFPDARVEEVFEVYTDDPEQARRLLHPEFGGKLLHFAQEYQASKSYIAAAFRGRHFYLAIDLPYQFMSFDVAGQPLSECENQIHKAMRDLMIPRRIIDMLVD